MVYYRLQRVLMGGQVAALDHCLADVS